MSLEKFTKEMAIIQQLDDEPNDVGGLTAAQLKAKFDEGGQALKDYLNETLLPALERLGVGAILQTASAQMKYLRVTADGVVQYSADGKVWTAVLGSAGTGSGGSVLFNTSQSLDNTQKQTARSNIGAVSSADVADAINEAIGDYATALSGIDAVIGGAAE